jgi:hypothetical protein
MAYLARWLLDWPILADPEWNHLFETQENLAELLHEEAAFDRALEECSKRGKSA